MPCANLPPARSVEIAPAHSANSALHDLTLSGHHSVSHHSATHHSTSHHAPHSLLHHSTPHHSMSHHSATHEELAHPAHLHLFGIIPVLDDRFTGFFFGRTCRCQYRRHLGSSGQKRQRPEPTAA